MNYELATNNQLNNIISHDKDIPTHLLSGVVLEMIKRKLWDKIIFYSAKKAYRNYSFVIENILKMDHEEFIQIAHIELNKIVSTYKPGIKTFKSYAIMCLIGKFSVLLQMAKTQKRAADLNTINMDKISVDFFQSSMNVENYVINKIMIEEVWDVLRDVEKKLILLEQMGYSKEEAAEKLGYNSKSGKTIIKRAYKKLRKAMVA
jgi:RNA polymerase sigma factor (sigma-70 family)